ARRARRGHALAGARSRSLAARVAGGARRAAPPLGGPARAGEGGVAPGTPCLVERATSGYMVTPCVGPRTPCSRSPPSSPAALPTGRRRPPPPRPARRPRD